VEVALKMAFRAFVARGGQEAPEVGKRKQLHVVGLTNGYHGDTLGVMNCAQESVFNEGQTPWYRPCGLFLEPPTVGLEQGVWKVCSCGCRACLLARWVLSAWLACPAVGLPAVLP
jgi:bifunctional dethiobiotin synthetase / adenosylmethionine---8-amino-7-oxononanoate aminotransferase